MDWPTILVSAAISALIGTFFSLLVVSRSTIIQMRAQSREEAGRQIIAFARSLQRTLRVHQDSGAEAGQHEGARVVLDDLTKAHRILEQADRLGWVRRRLVYRRAKSVFGSWTVERARLMRDDSPDSAFASWVPTALKVLDTGGDQIEMGSWFVATASPSDSPDIEECLKELRKLEKRI